MKRGVILLIILLIFAFHRTTYSKHPHPEKEYQRAWCVRAGGIAEYVLKDRTRVDCLTDEYAVEVDFAQKWAEAIGQAFYYATLTNRKPGVLLIIEKPSDRVHLLRIMTVAKKTGIKVWTMRPQDLSAAVTPRPPRPPSPPFSHR